MMRPLIAGVAAAAAAALGLAMAAQIGGTTTPAEVGSGAAGAPVLQVLSTGLPSGLRHAIYDAEAQMLWVLTRADADNSVLLTGVAANGSARTTQLSSDGADWAIGSLAVRDGEVWAAWGTHLVSFSPGTGGVRQVSVPWKDGVDGMEGRAASMAAAGACLWVAVIGEPQLHCYEPITGIWRAVSTPAGRTVSMFTKMASAGTSVLANLAAPANKPALPETVAEITWVPENTVPVSSGSSSSAVGVVGDDEVILGGAGTHVIPISVGSDRPAVTLPTAMGDRALVRASDEAGGTLVLQYADASTGATWTRSIAMPSITIRPHYAPQGATTRTAWAAPRVLAVAVEPDGDVWAVTSYGADAPSGWGTVVRLPSQ